MRRTMLAAAGRAAAVAAVASIVACSGMGGDQGTIDQSQVKITAAQAQTAATKAMAGTVEGIRLANARGITAYVVTIKGPDGTVANVDIDASNGQVLRQENGSEDDGDGG